jgi:predicted TIM-barrel fold metal-dependent hydrolase
VWGSDWPHTAFAPEAMPAYGSTWRPVVEALGPQAADALRRRRPAIYA